MLIPFRHLLEITFFKTPESKKKLLSGMSAKTLIYLLIYFPGLIPAASCLSILEINHKNFKQEEK